MICFNRIVKIKDRWYITSNINHSAIINLKSFFKVTVNEKENKFSFYMDGEEMFIGMIRELVAEIGYKTIGDLFDFAKKELGNIEIFFILKK